MRRPLLTTKGVVKNLIFFHENYKRCSILTPSSAVFSNPFTGFSFVRVFVFVFVFVDVVRSAFVFEPDAHRERIRDGRRQRRRGVATAVGVRHICGKATVFYTH